MKKFFILMLAGILGVSVGIGYSYFEYKNTPVIVEQPVINKIVAEPKEEKEYEKPEELSVLWQPSEIVEDIKEEIESDISQSYIYGQPQEDVQVKEPQVPSQEIEIQASMPDTSYPYVTSLATGEFYINIPKINIHNFWVSRGVGDEQSQLAVGGSLLNGTPYPNKYEGNAVIGGHREWVNNWNPFYYIDHLNAGDIIEVHINNEVLKYEVFDSYVVHETSVNTVIKNFGFPVLTLYSCTVPMSENRYVLHAKLKS